MKSKQDVLSYGLPSTTDNSFGTSKRINLVKKYVELKNIKILDAGCADANFLKQFKDYSNKVYGVDINPNYLEKAKKNCPDANFQLANLEKLTFQSNFFDLVFCNEVIEHTKNDYKAVSELWRVLKPGGYLVISVPNRWSFWEGHRATVLGHDLKIKFFLGFLPRHIRDKMCRESRTYSKRDFFNLFNKFSYKLIYLTHLYPSFDNTESKNKGLAKLLRSFAEILESSSMQVFGQSIFVILQKTK